MAGSDNSAKRLSILITGSTGYLGSRLLRRLLFEGHRVTALVRPESAHKLGGQTEEPGLRLMIADLAEARFEANSPAGAPFDLILHCAAQPKLAGASLEELSRAHVLAARNLSRLAERHPEARFFHLSTAYVGPDAKGFLSESAAVESTCRNPYELTKTRAEAVMMQGPLPFVEVFRPGIILSKPSDGIGPLRQSPLGPFFRALAWSSASGQRCFLPARSEVRPGFCFLSDIVDFILGRLRSPAMDRAVWNLVSPRSPRVDELAEALQEVPFCPRLELDERSSSRLFAAWKLYLSEQRAWCQQRTLAAAEAASVRFDDMTAGDFRSLAMLWSESVAKMENAA
ncbi:MAG: NAD(P)-dependent oxidoreductase [Sumerlaeia bacterium]